VNLPEPRPDGKCAECVKAAAVTRDKRFCLKCLKRMIAAENPIRWTPPRGSDHKQERAREDSPAREDAIRALEGD
jgi:hypothetical protein